MFESMFSMSVLDAGLLTLAALIASIISGATGMGGGILLLAVMTNFLSPAVLIPLHGVVQLVSNLSRSALLFSDINIKIVLLFAMGGSIGAVSGSQVLIQLPEKEFAVILALGILVLTWLPKRKIKFNFSGKFFFVGLIASFLSLFVGAIGPFIAPFFLHDNLNKKQIVATKAGCQSWTHILKIIVYFLAGFSLGRYFFIILVLTLTVILGNYIGKRILNRIPEERFTMIFRILITVIALKMIIEQILKD